MIRINLLPPEILQKRKTEGRLLYLAGAFLFVVTVLAVFWFIMLGRVNTQRDVVAEKQQEAVDLQAEAARYQVFEDKQADLQARKDIAQNAFAGQVDWNRLFEELSLVLPTDMWLDSMTADEAAGVSLGAVGVDWDADVPDEGFKPVAKMLVRLTDLEQLADVWVSAISKESLEEEEWGYLRFSVTASIVKPQVASEDETSAESVPAPPAGSAQ
jgi:Tfp pilus assembly protein PilN